MKTFARKFDKDCQYYDPEQKELEAIEEIVDYTDKKILDVGCGTGRLGIPIAEKAESVVALDKDKRLIEYAKTKSKRGSITFEPGEAENLDYKDEFDIVLLSWPDLEQTKKVIENIRRALKKEGKLIAVIPLESELQKILSKYEKRDRRDPQEIQYRIRANFRITAEKDIDTNYVFPSIYAAIEDICFLLSEWYGQKQTDRSSIQNEIRRYSDNEKIIIKERVKIIAAQKF